mmetsp:Transcript_10045/g.25079  ORF Transcript_10045/g.25079 Transcript_10045/m.25079 type:complete len:94 (-) Transcript_10045:217-498(-)
MTNNAESAAAQAFLLIALFPCEWIFVFLLKIRVFVVPLSLSVSCCSRPVQSSRFDVPSGAFSSLNVDLSRHTGGGSAYAWVCLLGKQSGVFLL